MTKNRALNIVILTTGLAYGGAETQLVNLALKLKKKGHKVTIISMLAPKAFEDILSAENIEILTLNMNRGVPDPRAIFKMVHYLRGIRPDVLHSHMVHANLLARITRLFYWVPVQISTIHNVNEGGKIRETLYRLTDKLSSVTTIMSEVAEERFLEIKAVSKKKLIYLPNGIDCDVFAKVNIEELVDTNAEFKKGNNFIWLAVGRFEVQKDYPNLLNAFAEVLKKEKSSILLIAGRGPLKEEMEQMAQDLKIDHRVHFLGLRKDIKKLMSVADGYVMSSEYEGMPMVLLEAAACELPIVATNVGGNKEVVIDNKTGILVESKNPRSLANGMLDMMNFDKDKLNMMGKSSREYVLSNFEINKIVNEWEKLYYHHLKKNK
ncbi:glycosyl transferase family 1 [Bacillus cereus]|uniref:glycosyltransferase n=1 Tax=Bacillus cereus TaxID=1396 RepID=UPI00099519F4|nr:glycosyltransferase [Bacillus cereus]OPA19007.1 glycosyl transferase family 1 [Bacillus cereus]